MFFGGSKTGLELFQSRLVRFWTCLDLFRIFQHMQFKKPKFEKKKILFIAHNIHKPQIQNFNIKN